VENQTKGRVFLKARWSHLILMNFPVPDKVLIPLLPPGVGLDRWEGSAYVSLVAFNFLETTVLNVSWPGYRNFAEINLRFYVRDKETRGVCFVREIVPQTLIAWIARALYNEPYVAAPVASTTRQTDFQIEQSYQLDWKGVPYIISAVGTMPEVYPPPESVEHFFKEHEWGYGKSKSFKKMVYRVEHPLWSVFPVAKWNLDFDFAHVYGESWQFLNGQTPSSVVMAKGSPIKVYIAQ
jgi:uncharacterized protein YqjF (DUF2071 family)